MTIREFDETIDTFWDLKNFCEDNGYEYFTDDIVDADTMDYIVIDRVRTMLANCNLAEIRDYLDDIPEGGDFYEFHNDGSDDITVFDDDDFAYLRREVREQLEMDSFFEEDDEEDEEDAVVEEEEEVVEDSEISINDMILASIA